jgi:hypothetical protein
MAFPLRTAKGADIAANESLSHPPLLARLSGPNRTPVMAVRWLSPAKT